MSQVHGKSEKTLFKQKLAVLIQKNAKFLLVLLIVIFAVIAGLLVFNSIQLKSFEKSTQDIESIQKEFENLPQLTEEGESEVARETIKEKLDVLIDNDKNNYALQRALFIRGTLSFQEKEWVNSIQDFKYLARKFPASYLAPISIINAAVAYEESGKIEEAINEYQIVIEKYISVSPELPNIYFSIGRLYEDLSDFVSATDSYNTLIDKFPDSNWTNLARSRIIYLETR